MLLLAGAAHGEPSKIVGSSSCASCHKAFYEKWVTSHHGLAMQPFTPEFAKKELTTPTGPLMFSNRLYRIELGAPKSWVIDGDKKYEIAHAMGGKNVYFFLTPLERGRLQVLPVAYDVRRKEWYDMPASAMRHFGDVRDTPFDWRDSVFTFNTSCYSCHVSQLVNNYDVKTDTYRTTWTEPGINCETCHGPAGEHVRLFENMPRGMKIDDVKLIVASRYTPTQHNDACAPCHAKMNPLTPSYPPGAQYHDHFDLATLEDPDFYPDGRDLGENFTETTWRLNSCVSGGKLHCVTCHTSSGRFRFAGDESNNACASCHAEQAGKLAEHTHHKAGSSGSKCIACHMPMTEFARMRRSDHSMRPPLPEVSAEVGSPDACILCHKGKHAKWAAGFVSKWHPDDKRRKMELQRARFIAAARKGDWSRLPDMLAFVTDPKQNEIFAGGLIRLLATCNADRKWPVLLAALKMPSPLVRARAAEALGNHQTPEIIAALVVATRDEYRLVRVRAAGSLAGYPLEYLSGNDRASVRKAAVELENSLKSRPDDSASHYNLGNYHLSWRRYEEAVAEFETAVKLRPDSLPPLVNAAMAFNALGQNEKAEASLRRALQLEPTNTVVNLNFGMLLAEMGKMKEAEQAFRTVLKTDPRSAQAAYNLGVLVASNRLDEAIGFCRTAFESNLREPKYGYTLAFYQHQKGDTDGAVVTLKKTIEKTPSSPDAYEFLGSLYEKTGKQKEMRELYRKASEEPRLSERDRQRFMMRLQALDGR